MDDIVTFTNQPDDHEIVSRIISEAIRQRGDSNIVYEPDAVRLPYIQALARMLWQAAVDGEVYFSNGSVMKVSENPKQWLDTVKFIAQHVDGGVTNNNNFSGINIFKVYKGIDPDLV